VTNEDNAPEIVQPVDHSQQPVLFPNNVVAQHTSITGIPPALYEKLEGEQMDTFLSNMNASDARWADVHKFKSRMTIIGLLVIVVAVSGLLIFGRPDIVPVVKDLLTHGAALIAGVLGGVGYQQSQQNSN
jgi:hypothetical protein